MAEDQHISLQDFAALVSHRMDEATAEKLVPHLAALCPVCRGFHREVSQLVKDSGHWDAEMMLQERELAEPAIAGVLEMPQDARLEAVSSDPYLQTWMACVSLLKQSRELVRWDAGAAVELALCAVRAGETLGSAYDSLWVLDLRARLSAHYANALRILGELRAAGHQFLQALTFSDQGTGDPEIRAEVLSLRASLRIDQREWEEARRDLDSARVLYREAYKDAQPGERVEEVLLSLLDAKLREEMGELAEAAALLDQLISSMDRDRHSRLYAIAVFNRLVALAYLGEERASELLPEVHRVYLPEARPTEKLRLRWTEGLIAQNRGDLGPAEAAYRECIDGFVEAGCGIYAALVAMDLAKLLLESGREDEMAALAQQILPILQAQDLRQEVTAIVVLLMEALRERRLTSELIDTLAKSLRLCRLPRRSE